ncbi:hypothetical protein LPN04_29575 [Rugamonas sp. A1-17]|nr:hypothetical protein [Rugamonas sp. A1-17]
MQLTEKFKSDAGVVAIVACVVAITALLGFGIVRDTWRSGQSQIAQQKLDENVSKTTPGKFAVENFTACKKAGGALSSPASDAQCISETVSGAEKLKGSAFGAQVTQELAGWLEQSKTLRAQ